MITAYEVSENPGAVQSSATATVPRPPFARRSRRAPERPHDYRLRGVQESGSGTAGARRFASGVSVGRMRFCRPRPQLAV